MYCFYASNTTDRIALIGNDVYDLNWYDYPSNVRKFMILIIVRSQRPMYLSGYHLINCTLETFGKVSNLMVENQFLDIISSKNF